MSNTVHQVAQRYVDDKKFSGIEWQIEKSGQIKTSGACGYARAAQKQEIPPKAIYRIYSMTKPIVSVLTIMLIERGELHLYDTVADFDPRFKDMKVLFPNGLQEQAKTLITVEQLLTHRPAFLMTFCWGVPLRPIIEPMKYQPMDIVILTK